jgi:hypothetical protein
MQGEALGLQIPNVKTALCYGNGGVSFSYCKYLVYHVPVKAAITFFFYSFLLCEETSLSYSPRVN